MRYSDIATRASGAIERAEAAAVGSVRDKAPSLEGPARHGVEMRVGGKDGMIQLVQRDVSDCGDQLCLQRLLHL